MSIQDKIKEIQEEIKRTQKNKKTEYHLALLKARLSRLMEPKLKLETKETSWELKKYGDCRISLIGFPSVGKSTLISKLTSVKSKTGEYEFTTLNPVAGKLNLNGSVIQIIDLPGIIVGAADNLGRCRQVISTARTSDLILVVLDPKDDRELVINELEKMNIRINRSKPPILFERTNSGGIQVIVNFKRDENKKEEYEKEEFMQNKIKNEKIEGNGTNDDNSKNNEKDNNLNNDFPDVNIIHGILKELKIKNCLITIQGNVTIDDIIDKVTNRAVYINCIFIYNKIDNLSLKEIKKLDSDENCLISAKKNWNLDELLEKIWNKLELKRIYTKNKGNIDFENPVILKKDGTVRNLCRKIHKDFEDNFKSCLVWGSSVKHFPQKVGINHVLEDEDVVQIFI